MLITVLESSRCLFLSRTRWMQSLLSSFVSVRYVLISSSNLSLVFPGVLYCSAFPTNNLYAFSLSPPPYLPRASLVSLSMIWPQYPYCCPCRRTLLWIIISLATWCCTLNAITLLFLARTLKCIPWRSVCREYVSLFHSHSNLFFFY